MIKIHTCDATFDGHDYYFRDYKEALEWLNKVDWSFLEEQCSFNCYIEMRPFYFWFSDKEKKKPMNLPEIVRKYQRRGIVSVN